MAPLFPFCGASGGWNLAEGTMAGARSEVTVVKKPAAAGSRSRSSSNRGRSPRPDAAAAAAAASVAAEASDSAAAAAAPMSRQTSVARSEKSEGVVIEEEAVAAEEKEASIPEKEEEANNVEERRDSHVSTASTETMERRRRLDHRNSEIQIEEILERVFLDVTSPQTACCDVQIPSRVHTKKITPPSSVKPPGLPVQLRTKQPAAATRPKLARSAPPVTAPVKKPSAHLAANTPAAPKKSASPTPRPSIAKPPQPKAANAPFPRPAAAAGRPAAPVAARSASSSATRKPGAAAAAKKSATAAAASPQKASTMTRTTSKLPQQKSIEAKPAQGVLHHSETFTNPFVVECQSEEVAVQPHKVEKMPATKVKVSAAAAPSRQT
ncbi:hypothetical protein PENTCL1PPCAC_4005, partial [Pristionchus entomophagus]